MEREYNELRTAYQREDILRDNVDQMPEFVDFHEAWSALELRFPKVCTFAGGFASLYPCTTRVESDFFVISWKKDDYRSSLMDLSLNGIMCCKQFKEIPTV